MGIGALIDLIVTLLAMALIGIIGYLLKGRFDAQDESLHELGKKVSALETGATAVQIAVAKLAESQKAVASNQTLLSHSQERLVSEADDLEDVTDQLQDATSSLRRRIEAHEELHRIRDAQPGT